ncbi:2Fe-2S iron-sulfur cluster-binding protein [Candidatus Poribacteria bacterium]
MVKFTLNDKELEVEEGKTILEAALDAGVKIPTLCYHKELTAYGACRVCLVEIVGGGRPSVPASCLYKVTEGLEVKTDTERVQAARKIVLELLLSRCPQSEVLTELAAEYDITETRIRREQTENCLLCGLCVRVCAQVTGRHAVSFSDRGARRKVRTPFDKVSEKCIGCGACAYLCPTATIKIEEAG